MSIRATCPKCGKVVKAGDDWAGRVGSCPGCGAAITFVAAAGPSSPPTPPPLPAATRADDAIDDELKRLAAEADLLPPMPTKPVEQPKAAAKRCPTRPIYSGSAGAVICCVLAVFVVLGGFLVQAAAESAIHEIEAGVAFIVAGLLFACGVLCSIHNTMRDVAHYQADLVRELAVDLRTDLELIHSELEWQRSIKEKEIVRAKKAARVDSVSR